MTEILKELRRARYGRRSERLRRIREDQHAFVFDELQIGIAAVESGTRQGRRRGQGETRAAAAQGLCRASRADRRLHRAGDADEVARVVEKVLIGEDVSERLDVIPAQFRVIVTHRPKYAYKGCGDGVFGAGTGPPRSRVAFRPRRFWPILPSPNMPTGCRSIARKPSLPASGVELDRTVMAPWMGKVGFELQPLADYVLERIKQAERIFADETRLPTLAPGTGKTKTAWLWAYARDDSPFGGASPPMVAYRFEDSRGGECVARHLEGYHGILQVDGYAAYNRLAQSAGANDGVTLAACFAHVRRKFYELHANGSSELATQTVTTMAKLWQIEDDLRGQAPEARVKARQENSATVVGNLFAIWEKELPRISGKSKLAEAIRYALARRSALERFLADGRIEINSNIVERAIRPQTITRKNSLFAGSDGGGRAWATIATMLQTAKINRVDPYAWLKQTLERLAQGWPINQIDDLMPWNFKASTV